jgi:hypothetical protein
MAYVAKILVRLLGDADGAMPSLLMVIPVPARAEKGYYE